MIALSGKWAAKLLSQPETGMGYQVVTVVLKDGRKFPQVAVVQGQIAQIRGRKDIPFREEDIAELVVTHDKWNFNADD
jgi:hypothetical protein